MALCENMVRRQDSIPHSSLRWAPASKKEEEVPENLGNGSQNSVIEAAHLARG